MKKYTLIAFLIALLLLSSCTGADTETQTDTLDDETAAEPIPVVDYTSGDTGFDLEECFTESDISGVWNEDEAESIVLEGTDVSESSTGVRTNEKAIVITRPGTYVFSGILYDGYILVSAKEEDAVQIVLDGVDITSSDFAAIYARSASKVFVTLSEGSRNSLKNTDAMIPIDSNSVDAVIFSKCDLTLNGAGSLDISSPTAHGIVGKDDLVIGGGTYKIDVPLHAVRANDSLAVNGGIFDIRCGKDAFHSENDEDATLGYMYIRSGEFNAVGCGDGFTSNGFLVIDGGKFEIANSRTENAAEDGSLKGIKCEGDITVNGGEFNISTVDDSIHAKNGSITVSGGTFRINSGDDAVKADKDIVLADCEMYISSADKAYKGETVSMSNTTLFALCSGAKRPSGTFTQRLIKTEYSGGLPGDRAALYDANGNELCSCVADCEFNTVFITSPSIERDVEYILTCGYNSITVLAN